MNSEYMTAGFFISSRGLGVSVSHFYEQSKDLWKETKVVYRGREYPAKLVARDAEVDLILVEAQGCKQNEFLRLSSTIPALGSRVWAFGFNFSNDLIVETGFVLEVGYDKLKTCKIKGIRSTLPGDRGFSGTAVLDGNGHVVGIHRCISMKFPDVIDSVAIPTSDLLNLLKKHNYRERSEGFS